MNVRKKMAKCAEKKQYGIDTIINDFALSAKTDKEGACILSCVHFEKGKMIATDGKIMAVALNKDYPQLEGKSIYTQDFCKAYLKDCADTLFPDIESNGKKYPQWQRAIPNKESYVNAPQDDASEWKIIDTGEGKKLTDDTIKALKKFVSGNKSLSPKCRQAFVRIAGIDFLLERLVKIRAFASKIGAEDWNIYQRKMRTKYNGMLVVSTSDGEQLALGVGRSDLLKNDRSDFSDVIIFDIEGNILDYGDSWEEYCK
jgi:hypothetical protein